MINLLAYFGEVIALENIWKSWHLIDSMTIFLLAAAVWYQRGVVNLWQRAGYRRGISLRQVLLFHGALLLFTLALQSPIEVLAEMFFTAHMIQHLLLIYGVALLLVMSVFPVAYLWALPRQTANKLGFFVNRLSFLHKVWHSITYAPVATVIFVLTFWLWHYPNLYELAIVSEWVHILEHLSFLIASFLFWWSILRPTRRLIHYGQTIIILFITALQGTLLGVLIVFSKQVWYETYLMSGFNYQFDAFQDQQLAGVIMWLPGSLLYVLLAGFYFLQWMNQIERSKSKRFSGTGK